jgi:hypothetical protein
MPLVVSFTGGAAALPFRWIVDLGRQRMFRDGLGIGSWVLWANVDMRI